jgi:hypothetical protein
MAPFIPKQHWHPHSHLAALIPIPIHIQMANSQQLNKTTPTTVALSTSNNEGNQHHPRPHLGPTMGMGLILCANSVAKDMPMPAHYMFILVCTLAKGLSGKSKIKRTPWGMADKLRHLQNRQRNKKNVCQGICGPLEFTPLTFDHYHKIQHFH